jgi:NADH-quinone oxidoreductase subunit M
VIAVASVFGVVLGAWYMLYLVERVFFGPLREPAHDPHRAEVRDLSLREVAALAPLVVFVFWIGLDPQYFLSRMQPALAPMSADALQALEHRPSLAQPAWAERSTVFPQEPTRVE